jgi:hypothetical protein
VRKIGTAFRKSVHFQDVCQDIGVRAGAERTDIFVQRHIAANSLEQAAKWQAFPIGLEHGARERGSFGIAFQILAVAIGAIIVIYRCAAFGLLVCIHTIPNRTGGNLLRPKQRKSGASQCAAEDPESDKFQVHLIHVNSKNRSELRSRHAAMLRFVLCCINSE